METTLEAVRKNPEYLEHYGVKGQRWGIRRTPEQLGHILKKKNARHYGKYNAAVKKISKIQGTKTINELSPKEKAKIEKAVNKAENYLKKMESTEEKYGGKIQKAETRQKASEEKLAAKEEIKRVKNEKLKDDILKKQDWNKAYEHKELFSTNELNDLATRVNTERRMQEALDGPSKMDKMANKAKSAANLLGSGLEVYGKIKSIGEALDEGKKNTAYKELRQLFADEKNEEIIKKSIYMKDEDIEKFQKRKKLLDDLRKGIGAPTPGPGPGPKPTPGPGSGSGSGNGGGSLSGTVEGVGRNSGRAHGIRGQKWTEIIDVPYEEVNESKLIEQKDKYLPLVLNDIGDFKIDDLRK